MAASPAAARRLVLNVGGRRFETTWPTVARHPDSMLAAWAADPARWRPDPAPVRPDDHWHGDPDPRSTAAAGLAPYREEDGASIPRLGT